MRLPARLLPLIGGLIVLTLLACGCDAPLSRDTLLDRLGRGNYAVFTVTYYRYAPSVMQTFAAGIGGEDYLYEQILALGPIERLDLSYRPNANRCTITRGGNDLAADRREVSKATAPGRGPLEEIIRLVKDNPTSSEAMFSRDLYAASDTADPDYFQSVDSALRSRIANQSGTSADWQFVEFTLQYRLPQAGPPVYTAEAALIPLGGANGGSQAVATLKGIADREFGKLPDPLAEDTM